LNKQSGGVTSSSWNFVEFKREKSILGFARLMAEKRVRNLFPRYGNGDLRLSEMEPSRGLPPSSSKYRRERTISSHKPNSQNPNLDTNLMNHLLFLINQDPRDLLRKLDELREHLSRTCEISDKPRERHLQPVSRNLSSSSFGHHHNQATSFPEVCSPGNHFSPHHLHSLNRHYMLGENGVRTFNERYRRVRVHRDPCTQYSMRSRENTACCSSYGDSHHSFEDNSYFASAERSSLSLQDYDRRSIINAPLYSPRVESFKRRAKSYLPMNGASPFAICDGCFALLQLPAGFVFNSNKRDSQFKCGACSKVIGLKLPKGKHNFSESHSIGSSKGWKYGSSNNFSREGVYSKDVKSVSLSTNHDFEDREYGYGLSDIETPRKDMNGRDFREASSGTYEARDVSVNEVLEDTGERNMVEDMEKDENKSCIEDVKKTVEIDQLADVPLPGKILGVTSVNEETYTKAVNDETEMKAEIDRSTEPVEMEIKDDFEMSTEPTEESSSDTVQNGSFRSLEEIEMSTEDVPVEVEKNPADAVALKGNTENKEEMKNSNGDMDVAFEVDSVNSHSIASSSYRESSRGSFEVRLDEEQGVAGKNGDSFFGGLVKRSFKELPLFNRSTERSKCRVWVNGRPISDRAVKRAEKKAGPIDPGDYW
jgi:Probable zinc-ribbon domain